MKLAMKLRLAGGLFAGLVLTLGMGAANATGTAANTSITNKATVNYQVGGISQTLIESSPTGNSTAGAGNGTNTSFLVDDKISLTVTETDTNATVNVSPGATAQVLTFLVTNTGNATHDYSVADAHVAGAVINGHTDNFTATSVNVYVNSVQNEAGCAYAAGTDTATYVDELPANSSVCVFVVATIPGTQVNGDTSVFSLTAQTRDGGVGGTEGTVTADQSGTAWVATTLQHIFADAAGSDDAVKDGKESVRGAYYVQSAKLTITKTATVVTDPVNCTTAGNTGSCTGTSANFKSIPGSVMKYTVTVHNDTSATANASSVGISDNLSAQIGTNLTWFTGGMTVTADGVNGGAAFTCADDGSSTTTNSTVTGDHTAVTCDYNKTTAKTVTVSGITLDPNDTATITYEVTIN